MKISFMTEEEAQARAAAILADVIAWQNEDDDMSVQYKKVGASPPSETARRNRLIEKIKDQLKMVNNAGRLDAQQEMLGAPWEFVWCSLNTETMNDLSAKGWELCQVAGAEYSVFLWRRRRAVREIEKPSEAKNDA